MSTFYSHNGNWPVILPNRIVLSNGKSRTDKSTFTAEELADAGWVAVSDPPTVEYPNKLAWDGSNWFIRQPTQAEIDMRLSEIRKTRDEILKQTDVMIIRAYEQGLQPDPLWVTYRQELRDLPQNIVDPFYVTWPTQPE